jgi:hypothetical protein
MITQDYGELVASFSSPRDGSISSTATIQRLQSIHPIPSSRSSTPRYNQASATNPTCLLSTTMTIRRDGHSRRHAPRVHGPNMPTVSTLDILQNKGDAYYLVGHEFLRMDSMGWRSPHRKEISTASTRARIAMRPSVRSLSGQKPPLPVSVDAAGVFSVGAFMCPDDPIEPVVLLHLRRPAPETSQWRKSPTQPTGLRCLSP